ncbi:MAG: hypothetical protein H8D23_16720 [Candidatus Brocadiales bacterium]|nr:hypothetical protein [Candidatus Brocadiales bacterium]
MITGIRIIKTIAYDMRVGEVMTIGNTKCTISGFTEDLKQIDLTPIYDEKMLHNPDIRKMKPGARYRLDVDQIKPEKNIKILDEQRLPIGDIAHGDKL